MKALYALCLSLAAFAFARPAQAELEYLVYDLSTGHTETVTNPDVTAEVYHTGSKMLFVRDPNVADKTYYIGVFEVTRAQAATLKWTGLSENNHDGWAYGTNTEGTFISAARSLPKNLAFPTHAQWKAYTDDPATLSDDAKKDINIKGGASSLSRSVERWYNEYLCASPSQLLPNSHGVYDIYGNVAEYATGGKGEGPFYGGAAASADSFANLSDTSFDKLRLSGKPASRYNENNANVCGARLVYMPPKEQFYSVTVTLDDADVTKATVTVPEGMTPAELKVGTSVTVSAPTPAEWHRLSGRTVTPDTLTFTEAVDAPITFNMPGSDVVIAYTSEPYGTITVEGGMAMVTHDEETISAENGTEVVQGDIVTLLAVESAAYERFTGWTVTKDGGEPTPIEPTTDDETQESAYTYTIPELQGGETFAFTAHFEIIPYATLTVKNGYAQVNGTTVTEVVNEDEVTLIHNALGAHQVFNGWVAPEGITVEDNRFTVSDLTGLGERLTFEAKIQTYPFVRVFGGKVSSTEGGHNDGEGYYHPGTKLNLTASGLDGYTHTGWSVTVNGTETESSLQGNSYTIPANTYDVTIAITALYKAPTEPGEVDPGTGATIRLGYADTEGTKAYDLFGSEVAADVKLDDGYGNVYAFPGYVPAGAIATFDLTDNSISYGEPAADAEEPPSRVGYEGIYAEFWREYMAWWQKAYGTESTSYSNAALTLRRVTRATDDPYDDFYLGVYETSMANVAYLQKLCVPNEKERLTFLDGRTGDAKPYCFTKDFLGIEMTERDALIMRYPVPKVLSMIGEAFEVTVAAPNKSDLVAVAGTPPADNPGAGQGANKDTKIVKGMVVCSTNNTVTTVYGMDPDPYGFYGIWGSQWEYVAEGVAVGGARDRGFGACYVDNDEGFTIDWNRPYGITFDTTFRPKVAVEKPVTVTVQYRVGEATTKIGTVEVTPGKPLFADFEKATPVRAGYTFLRWELDGKALTKNPTLAADQTTATLTAVWEESSVFVEFEYVDCMGPSVGYPGQTICVYPPEGRQFVPHSHAIDMSAEDEDAIVEDFIWPDYPDSGKDHLDFEDGSERFVLKTSFTVTEPVTITGTLEPIEEPEPEPEVKPGYRFRLR